mgnify:CR=1 FL=1
MKDYGQTRNGDLDLSTGDLYPIESTAQHQRDLLLSAQGHIRHKPEAGVGAVNYLLNEDKEGLLRQVRKEMAADGQKVTKVAYSTATQELEIKADYEND